MADKQRQLRERVPELVAALTTPSADPVTGLVPNAVSDLHVGAVTSSLGAHGSYICDPVVQKSPDMDDGGHLLPRSSVAAGGVGYIAGTGEPPPTASCEAIAQNRALTWTFDVGATASGYVGAAGAQQLQAQVSCFVGAANELGCGFEETWESMYHFLIDPAPYQSAKADCTYPVGGGPPTCTDIVVAGVDNEILHERAAFLRPDSLLGVVVMSDENDFSLKPTGTNWLPWAWTDEFGDSSPNLEHGWGACANIADDIEPETLSDLEALGCHSCYQDSSDTACTRPWPPVGVNVDSDQLNLRGFHQVQRYGVSFLWSRQRYVDAFTTASVLGSDGLLAANPVFAGGQRSQDMIVVAGIVGVPKRLVEDAGGGALATLTDAQWDMLISPDLAKRDPHMIESIAPRAGLPAYAGTVSVDALGNVSNDNGGERDVSTGSDLQYACIGSRNGAAPDPMFTDCRAGGDDQSTNPLCGPASGDVISQPYFKAYPGLRHLRILHDLGSSGLVASICNSTYAPAVASIVAKLQMELTAPCVSILLTPSSIGEVPCEVVEVFAGTTVTLPSESCEARGKSYCTPGSASCNGMSSPFVTSSTAAAAAKIQIALTTVDSTGISTTSQVTPTVDALGNVIVQPTGASESGPRLVCAKRQLAADVPGVDAADAEACQSDPADTAASVGGGWCYSSKASILGSQCVAQGAAGTLRFLGGAEPKTGSDVFAICESGSGT